jgi:DNA-binding protein H-NS
MARNNGLDKMTFAQLRALRDRVDAAMVAAQAAEKKALRAEIEALAAKRGLSVAEALDIRGTRKGSKVPVKYRNPKDPSQTWTGRGRQPRWLAAALKKGQKLDSFRI